MSSGLWVPQLQRAWITILTVVILKRSASFADTETVFRFMQIIILALQCVLASMSVYWSEVVFDSSLQVTGSMLLVSFIVLFTYALSRVLVWGSPWRTDGPEGVNWRRSQHSEGQEYGQMKRRERDTVSAAASEAPVSAYGNRDAPEGEAAPDVPPSRMHICVPIEEVKARVLKYQGRRASPLYRSPIPGSGSASSWRPAAP